MFSKFLGRTAIITGSNSGIGKETALDFARRGARVILACRDEKKASEAAKDIISETGSDKVIIRVLDLASFESVRAFAKLINETEERVDILVNNAGIGPGPLQITKDGYESIFQVNYLSHFLLTLLLLEKIKKSAPSRIVNVSTNAHTLPFLKVRLDDFKPTEESFNSYTRCFESKLAQVVFTKELSRRLEGKDQEVKALQHTLNNSVIKHCGGVCGRGVNTSNSGPGGPEFKPHLSPCFLRQGTELYSTLLFFTQVYKWVTRDLLLGVTL